MAIPIGTFRDPKHYKGLTDEQLVEILWPRRSEQPRRGGFDSLDAVMWLGWLSLWF
jgi:hypothetical protein